MAELTLKDESVLEIGKSVSQSFEGLANTGKSILVTPSGQPLNIKADQVSVDDEQPQKGTAQVVFEGIRDGVNKLVEVFTSSFNFQKQEAAEDDIQERVGEAQATEIAKEDDGVDRSFFTQDFKDKISELTSGLKERTMAIFGGLGGLLKKGGLFALLLAFALNINKFSGQIGEVTKPIIEGFKNAFASLKEDFFPFVENILETFGTAFTTVSNLLKGLFQGDGSMFVSGLKGLLLDLPLQIVSIIGDGFFSLVDAALKFFGVESQMIQDIKIAFRTLPEAVTKFINDSINFITETIPQFFTDMKDQAIENARNNIAAIKDMFKNAFNFITEDIPNYFSGLVDSVIDSIKETVQSIKDAIMAPIKAIKEKVGGVFSGVKDFFTGGDDKMKAEKMSKDVSGMSDKEKNYYETVNAKKDEINKFSKATGYRFDLQGTRFSFLEGNEMFSFEDPRTKDGYMTDGKDFNAKDAIDFINSGASASFKVSKNLSTDSNTPTISPQDLNKGNQLNKESADFASAPPVQQNMQITKGGTNNVNTANNTYTTILEDTGTSDKGIRQYLSA